MFSLFQRRYRTCNGVSRREALRVGGLSALGVSLANQAVADTGGARAKSVILFWLSGGPPQHDTWDPKPDAAVDVRGTLGTISSSVPGIQVGELMPKTASHVDKLAILRAVVSNDNAHSSSGYQMLTGIPHQPRNRENATSMKPNLYPSLGALTRKFLPEAAGLPSAMTIPRHIANTGEIVWPGQDAGFLGRQFDPWLVTCDPSAKDFRPPALALTDGLTLDRLNERRALLTDLNRKIRKLDGVQQLDQQGFYQDQAFHLLAQAKTRAAFDLDKEPAQIRDRYGWSKFGQSVLLARRLIEHDVKLVQVNWPASKGKVNNGSWDTHAVHELAMKDHLMPIMDQAFSALLEDLDQRGMLDETIVAWVGEFGRTPKFNTNAGRDHWGSVFSVALAGAGIRGGTVWGKSDSMAAQPVEGRVFPADISATILDSLGIRPNSEIIDEAGRPLPASRGRVIREILA
jgi:hypothetical protein